MVKIIIFVDAGVASHKSVVLVSSDSAVVGEALISRTLERVNKRSGRAKAAFFLYHIIIKGKVCKL